MNEASVCTLDICFSLKAGSNVSFGTGCHQKSLASSQGSSKGSSAPQLLGGLSPGKVSEAGASFLLLWWEFALSRMSCLPSFKSLHCLSNWNCLNVMKVF